MNIYTATEKGALEFVIEYLRNGDGHVDTLSRDGESILLLACKRSHYDLAENILTHGANVNINDHNKTTPLHYASDGGKKELVALLLNHGADINRQNSAGDTPLHLACFYGHKDVVVLLCSRGARVDLQNTRGFTPLHDACNRGYAEIVSYLLVQGADCTLVDRYGFLPSDIAKQSGNVRCLIIFLKYMHYVTYRRSWLAFCSVVSSQTPQSLKFRLATEKLLSISDLTRFVTEYL